ncbi:MAG: hypothetical protein ACOY5R_01350 [Pseudomonadota bacterium]|uniref:hypothetical protein n=1 Tax=Rhizorhabdus phycosphaerae TaxID=2711156 RepID=UPI0013EB6FAB|nr:hypothetical protein [Rhizorhabdus phycosphaerae]
MRSEADVTEEANGLIALHGAGAVQTLLDRIAQAVRRSDDELVTLLDKILQCVERTLEQPRH